MSLFPNINSPAKFLTTKSWIINRFFTNYGYIEDGSGNDLLYSSSPMVTTPIRNTSSLKNWFKPISNQYHIGSCVANAAADSFEAMLARRKNCDPSLIEDLSRLFIYWNARNLANPPIYNVDKGSSIRLAFDSIARYGVPSEKTYPYIFSKVNDRPTILSYREAIKNRISKFYRIDGKGDVRILQIMQALSAGYPVVFGTKVTESFKQVKSDAIVFYPNGGWIGGHAMVIVGWSESKQAFEVRNSWGEDWGVKGYCWMDKGYITASVTADIWVPTV